MRAPPDRSSLSFHAFSDCWHHRRHLAISHAKKAREYRNLLNIAYEVVLETHERRLLTRCCLEWRENVPKHKAAGKIQAVWRGGQGRLLVALTRDRDRRFEKVAGVLRAM